MFAVALLTYGLTALLTGHWKADPVYFNHLADAFLHGRLYLADPPGVHDLTEYDGRWYVPFPPLPALLMLPWVALFGAAGVNGVVFSILVGAMTVALVWRLLDEMAARDWIGVCGADRLWLTALFALGTVHWYVACEGSVWFLSQVCTVLFSALAALLAITSAGPWPAAAALAVAMLARPHVALVWPLLAGIAAMKCRDAAGQLDRQRWQRCCVRSALLPAMSAALLMLYNYGRFGNPFDFGYDRQNIETGLRGDLYSHGQFSLYHVPRNVQLILLGTPELPRESLFPVLSDRGMSVFLTTPALLFLFAARRRDALIRGGWVATGLLLLPLVLYYNTGWRQFGYRFLLDLIVPLIVLLAIAAGPKLDRTFRGLIAASIAINLWGTVWWFTTPVTPPE